MTKPTIAGPFSGIKMPKPAKRGVKPVNIDHYISEAIAGRDAGLYETAGQAAYAIAKREHGLTSDYFDPLRCMLKRRLRDSFNK